MCWASCSPVTSQVLSRAPHLKPGITIAFAVFCGLPGSKVVLHMFAQLMETVQGYNVYSSSFPCVPRSTTSPTKSSHLAAFANEFVASALLMSGVLVLFSGITESLEPSTKVSISALIVTTLGFTFGYTTGLGMNTARVLIPHIVAACVTRSASIFTIHEAWYLWGSIVAPLLGCLRGPLVYDLLIYTGVELSVNWHFGARPADLEYT